MGQDMWSHLIKVVSLSKSAVVVGVAASAALVSNAELSTAPSHAEQPSATPAIAAAAELRPASSAPFTVVAPKGTEAPVVKREPSTTKTEPDVSGVVKECVTKYAAVRAAGDSASQGDRQSASSVCKAAIEQSGLTSSEFAAKYGLEKLPTAHPAESTVDMTALVKDCFEKYTARDPGAGDACKRAIAASGLSTNDFFAKYGTPVPPATEPKPTTTAKSTTSAVTYALIAKCLQLSTSTQATNDSRTASDACAAAIKASGLSATEFWGKFGKQSTSTTKPSTTPVPATTPKPVTNTAELALLVTKCLDLYKAAPTTGDTHALSEACGAAVRASGLSSADFWAKFHPATN